ncbi:hypothetical protein N8I77_000974 [Diaporthe amygdali]|uniref:Deacetylase sirtuin-type domain-containing protein n=1 Tax=Phomopsis amygdali TaxID=1214568 RepID=A0AAD9SRX2_PHOAM|nr:hypothetical protein N8I77_000974 [Diaporthe amygdali]
MPTIHVQAGSTDQLQEIADSLWKAKKVVIVTGAGISTNSGIPDFRSENGLYSMIQGQFDAAAKLHGSKNQANGVTPDDSGDERRPRKRRKMSLVGDSIEVGVPRLARDATVEGDSIRVLDPNESQVSDGSEGNNSGELVEENNARPSDEAGTGYDRADPCEEEVVLLTEESVLAGESTLLELDGQRDSQRKFDGQSLSREDAHYDGEEKGNTHEDSEVQAQPASTAVSSRRTSRRGSPALKVRSLHQQRQDTTSSELDAPKSPKCSSDPRNASSSESSTPKQTPSDSGAQTNTLSSPLSSPPPVLSDPYEEVFPHSSSSSSRCTSPETASEAEDSPRSSKCFNYSQTFKRASLSTMKGRDLFDASIWSDPIKTSVFYTFATNLRQKSRDAYPTGSHHFISRLRDSGRMVRCYTQNIDLLEDKVGLSTRLLLGPGSRSRFSARASRAAAAAATASAAASAAATPAATLPADDSVHQESVDESSQRSDVRREEDRKDGANGTAQPIATDMAKGQCTQGGAQTVPCSPEPDRGVECVYLHGSLRSLRCFQCGGVIDWDEGDRELQTMSGHQPPCPRCEDATTARQEKGKRALGVGKLRPDIVLYGEEHPESQRISDIIQHDLSLAPDLLIIMGTSLKVHGLKTVVKEFAKAIHNKKDGKVIFVNYTKPADSVWADTIDFWVEMDCDAWVHDLKEKKPIIWSPPGTIDDESRSTKRRRRTNVDTEKAINKTDSKSEAADQMPLVTPKSTTKKAEKKCSQATSKPSVPKPAPKRPVSEREHKDNGAYWTTRIMANLALLSGREVKKYSTISTNPAPAKRATGSGQAIQKPAESVAPKQPLKKGRGPRLKNARTRKPVPAAVTSEDDGAITMDQASHQPDQTGDQKPGAVELLAGHLSLELKWATSIDKCHVIDTKQPKPDPDMNAADKLSSQYSRAATTHTAETSQGGPVTDAHAGGLDAKGEGNSILAAVKSHHRIRRPKTIFEPEPISVSKSGRGTPASASNAKSRTKSGSQAKKVKALGKTVKTEQPGVTQEENNAILPPPRPCPGPASQSNTSNHPGPRRYGTPDEIYTLPPLHPENLESYKYSKQSNDLPYPPAKPLEPIVVVEGPPSDMSPTSPQHWQNRAFLLRDPQSRNFEGPCRGLDFVGMSPAAQPDGLSVMMGTPPPPSQLATQLAMITAPPSYNSSAFANAPILLPQGSGTVDVQLPPEAQSIHDSPSRQLRHEEALEAAAALNQLRSPPVFDERRFLRI